MTAQDALAVPFTAKLTVADYLLLDRSGAFDAYAKTELIDGAVVAVNAQFSEHFTVSNRLYLRLVAACAALDRDVEAWMEGSIGMPPHNVPQPDMFVTNTTPVSGLVDKNTVLLIVEVASTTLRTDLRPDGNCGILGCRRESAGHPPDVGPLRRGLRGAAGDRLRGSGRVRDDQRPRRGYRGALRPKVAEQPIVAG
ncbi:Uma2 family endonuclease [Sphingomonas sp. PAMC 26621]|uniref:Uma2 family endonuclease n=1 Tax=Sphingomonas sp. PAMC 26621 TaxID=1112213 RepID=UPI000287B96E